MLALILDYIKNNPQQVMFLVALSVAVIVLIAFAITIWINQYRYRKHQGFGRKHFELREFDKSIDELKIAQRLAKKTLSGKKRDAESTSCLLAEVSIAATRWDEAIQALKECISISPDKMEYHVSLVENYLRAKEQNQAREALDVALRLVSPARIDELGKSRIHAMARIRHDENIGEELDKLTRAMAVVQSEMLDRLEILKPDFEGREFILEGLIEEEKDVIGLAKFYIRQYILEGNGAKVEEGVEAETEAEPESEETEDVDQETPDDIGAEAAPVAEEQIAEEQTVEARVEEELIEDIQEEISPAQVEEIQEEQAEKYREESYLIRARESLDMLELDPETAEFHTLSAFLSVEEGDPKAAEENYEKAIFLNPQYAEAYYDLALLCVDKFNDPERAIGYFRGALESNPAFAEAHHNLALLLLGSGENTLEVKHHLGEAIKINPRFSEVYHNVALLLAKKDCREFLLG
ncbi:MAG: tetratricopeptide repeat protein [Gammaproteobacteria bacterium]|nr:tetratricopeptide repeat protein [Gammaproteobacteria bacterium]